jgi:hypothetical protein
VLEKEINTERNSGKLSKEIPGSGNETTNHLGDGSNKQTARK